MNILFLTLLSVTLALAQQPSSVEWKVSLLDALNSALRNHPVLQIQEQQVRFSRGALLLATSQFDPVLQADAGQSHLYQPFTGLQRLVFDASSSTENLTTFTVSARQQFRNGMSVGPEFDAGRTTDNISTPFGLSQSHLGFQITIPFLRGRGSEVVRTPERIAGSEVTASLLDLNQTISDLLAAAASAYWSAAAAKRLSEVYEDAERRGETYVHTVKTLIEADKLPRADISQVMAHLSAMATSRIAGQQQASQSRQNLALAMGRTSDQMAVSPDTLDSLPAFDANSVELPRAAERAFVEVALHRRADVLAARSRAEQAAMLLSATKNQLKPQLDVRFSTGYSGLREGTRIDRYLLSPFTGVRGIDVGASIHYQLPVGNRAAEASVMQAGALERQAAYRLRDKERNVVSSVITALDALRFAKQQLENARDSVGFARNALDNERTKLRLGAGSLLDILTVEDRLNSVLTSEVQAELDYALALVRLRHATGTIVEAAATTQNIDRDLFLTAPEPSEGNR